MAINELPENKPQAPNDLTETAESKPGVPTDLTEVAESTPAVPNNLTEESEVTPAAPNNLAEVSESIPAAPNDLTEISESNPASPNNLTEVSESTPAIPNNLTELAESTPAAPTDLTELSEVSPAAPNNLTEVAESAPAAPNTLTLTENQVIPRTLTPRINLDFEDNGFELNGTAKALTDIVTYSRSSSATYIERFRNQFGQFDYRLATDYVGTVENLVTYSEQFDNAAWGKSDTAIQTNKDRNPINGARDADRLYAQSATSTLYTITETLITVTSGATVNLSIYAKAGTETSFTIFEVQTNDGVRFDLESGVIISEFGTPDEGSITYISDGWYRCSCTVTVPSTRADFRLYLRRESGVFSADGTEYISIWGAQLTESAKPLPYVKTTASSASETFAASPRLAYDAATGESLGYLAEGGTTNLQVYSEDFDNGAWSKASATITANNTVAPDGTKSADSFVASSGSVIPNVNDSITSTVSTVYTFSGFAKAGSERYLQFFFGAGDVTGNPYANFDLLTGTVTQEGAGLEDSKIESCGNGWYRCSATVTAADTALQCYFALMASGTDGRATVNSWSGGENIYIWGAQIEAQAFATSYVRTEGSTVSRSGDDGNGSIYLNQSMTIHCSLRGEKSTGSDYVFIVGTDNNNSVSLLSTSDFPRLFINSGGATSADIIADTELTQDIKVTITIEGGQSNLYVNGVLFSSDSTTIVPLIDSFYIGASLSAGQNWFGYIKQIKVYDKALTAQEVSLL